MRQNRSKIGASWRPNAPKIAPDEKLVAFRMSMRRYQALKAIAGKHSKPIAQLINEILDQKLKLELHAVREDGRKEKSK